MTKAEQTSNKPQVEDDSRRDFLRNNAYAAAGAVAMGLTAGGAATRASAAADEAAAEAGDVTLISPTFESSPTYQATYPASDRAKKIVKDAIVVDTLFSGVG